MSDYLDILDIRKLKEHILNWSPSHPPHTPICLKKDLDRKLEAEIVEDDYEPKT